MNNRQLGSTELQVSEIGFGAWQLCNDAAWGAMDDRTALRLIDAAIDSGVNLFDTAPNYANTNSERILGKGTNSKRDNVILVSKFGHTPDGSEDFTIEWFWKSLDSSLSRLRTDYLDVLLLHNPPSEIYGSTDPLWAALDDAQAQGKIRHYGASLDSAAEVETCLANTGSEVLEILFNIFQQDVRYAFDAIRQHGVGTIAKVPLDSGWLTGRFDANSRFEGIRSRWTEDEIARRAELVRELDWLVADGSDLAHKAIGFLLSYDEVSCVIPGIRTEHQLESNLAAAGSRLSPDQVSRLEEFWEQVTDKGRQPIPW